MLDEPLDGIGLAPTAPAEVGRFNYEEPLPESSPLWDFENVVITPHVGGRSKDFVRRFVDLFLYNYDRRKTGESLKNRIV